ncbi:MAG: sigma-70 family RNA polymerase sigma factor [Chitinivibrionales bacterium]|nr:sigma-70 family RNA polymerase sigma factor [Chitinivibrionales bacterium]
MRDPEILKKLAGGDRSAFAAVVREYQSMVFTTCFRVLGNREEAEDAAQDVFVQLFKKAHTFRGDSKISTWLYRIAFNTALNHIRKRKWVLFLDIFSFAEKERGEIEYIPPAPEQDRPDNQFDRKNDRTALTRALGKIPAKQRIAFILSKYDNFSYEEISRIMKTSISSVESLIHRAKMNLQKKLAYYYERS